MNEHREVELERTWVAFRPCHLIGTLPWTQAEAVCSHGKWEQHEKVCSGLGILEPKILISGQAQSRFAHANTNNHSDFIQCSLSSLP